MTSVESLVLLGDLFERVVKPLDLGLIIQYVRSLATPVYIRHFKGFRPQTLGRKRITQSLHFEVFEKGNETVADILVLLWNQKMRHLFNAMADHVKTINENVEEVESIPDDKANEFLDDMLFRFDREDVLICVRINDVRFSPEVIARRLEGILEDAEPEEAEPVPETSEEAEPGPETSDEAKIEADNTEVSK